MTIIIYHFRELYMKLNCNWRLLAKELVDKQNAKLAAVSAPLFATCYVAAGLASSAAPERVMSIPSVVAFSALYATCYVGGCATRAALRHTFG
jgi:hypothetical protein